MQHTDTPSFVLRDLARNQSAMPEARLAAGLELYARDGEAAFSSVELQQILAQVRSKILNGNPREFALAPSVHLDLLQHIGRKLQSVSQDAAESHTHLSQALEDKHAAVSIDLGALRDFTEDLARTIHALREEFVGVHDRHEKQVQQQAAINNSVSDRLAQLEDGPQHAEAERHDLAERVARLEACWLVRLALRIAEVFMV